MQNKEKLKFYERKTRKLYHKFSQANDIILKFSGKIQAEFVLQFSL